MIRNTVIALGTVLFAAGSAPVRADEIHLTDGRIIEVGEATGMAEMLGLDGA